jgi:hypothetical protein
MAEHDYRRRRYGCTQRYLPTDQVEDKVTDHDRNITLDPSRLGRFRQQVTEHIEITRRLSTKEIDHQQRRLTKLRGTGDVPSPVDAPARPYLMNGWVTPTQRSPSTPTDTSYPACRPKRHASSKI